MTFWTAVVVIVALGIIGNMYRDYIQKELKLDKEASAAGGSVTDAVMARLEKLEQRMASLETIVLEQEKKRPFEELK